MSIWGELILALAFMAVVGLVAGMIACAVLGGQAVSDDVALEAAELMKQMRAEIERLRANVFCDPALCRSEIERLKAALIHNSEWRDENIRVWAEVERLRAALRGIIKRDSRSIEATYARAALEGKS